MLLDIDRKYNFGFTVAAILLVSGLSYSFIVVIYRLTLHPLAKYPGPVLATTSCLWTLWHARKGDRHLALYEGHKKYGPIFRYAPNALSFNTNTAIHTIHGVKANCQKASFYEAYPTVPKAWSIVSAIPKDIHARKKRVLSQAFSDRAVKEMEPYMLNHIRQLCTLLAGKVGEEKNEHDMSVRCDDLVFDLFSELCFGKSFGMQESNANRTIRKLINYISYHHFVMAQIPFLDRIGVDKIIMPKATTGANQFRAYSKSQAMARAEAGPLADSGRKDIFHHVVTATDPETGKPLEQNEIWSEAGTLIVAGADTSSTCLAAIFYYLSRSENQSVLTRLSEELKTVFLGSDIEAIKSGPELNSCNYLRACVDEALRMSPPVPGLLPREVLLGGMVIDGHNIPASVDVGTPCYSIHHNEEYFSEPFAYKPERWLKGETSAETLETQHSAFFPFLVGPRGCLGKAMAYTEILITVARIVWLFDFHEAGNIYERGFSLHGDFPLTDYFVADKDGPILQFSEKKRLTV